LSKTNNPHANKCAVGQDSKTTRVLNTALIFIYFFIRTCL